jgi:Glycosyltransferase family 9 (heptosyltransferase)
VALIKEAKIGSGDEIIGTGLARGMHERGKLAAFGDGHKIIWGPWCKDVFANNPNIAAPGSEQRGDIVWIAHYKGCRKYNKLVNGRWHWNYDFKVRPGEFYFSETEKRIRDNQSWLKDFIVIEPNVEWHKAVAPNKDWGAANYDQLTERLLGRGHRVLQFIHKNSRRRLGGVDTLEFHRFRDAIAVLSLARLYIGPEGGMHHAAAAVGIDAVVIMGGFIPPSVVGYDRHINLTGGAEACGTIGPCEHCRQAMANISVDEVWDSAMRLSRPG